MENSQYAVYRVDKNSPGKDLWQKSYEQVKAEKRRIGIEYYRQLFLERMEPEEKALDVWNRIRDRTEISDVLVFNRMGEVSCFYVNEGTLQRIAGFIRINPSGAVVTLNTKDYQIEGIEGRWMAADDLIINGRQFFLMEHQKFHRHAAMVILDAYGRTIAEECRNGFDQAAKRKIHEYIQSHPDSSRESRKNPFLVRMDPWRKYFENGTYERGREAGLEVNYGQIDGCVNNQKYNPGKAAAPKKKKRESVIRKLRQKQIAIAKRSGRPVPKYLEQQMELSRQK